MSTLATTFDKRERGVFAEFVTTYNLANAKGENVPNKPRGTVKGHKTTSQQQKLMGIARGVQKGETSPKYSPQATKIAKSIEPSDLHKIAQKPKGGFRKKK